MTAVAPFLAPHRDDGFVIGRVDRSGADYYTVPGVLFTSTGVIDQNPNFDRFGPFFVKTPTLVDQLALEVTSGVAGNFRMGLYRANHDWQPMGAPLCDSGDISTGTTGVKTYSLSTPLLLKPGRYLTVFNTSAPTTGPSFRRFFGGMPAISLGPSLGGSCIVTLLYTTRTYGAFPTPSSWSTQSEGTNPHSWYVLMRVSRP